MTILILRPALLAIHSDSIRRHLTAPCGNLPHVLSIDVQTPTRHTHPGKGVFLLFFFKGCYFRLRVGVFRWRGQRAGDMLPHQLICRVSFARGKASNIPWLLISRVFSNREIPEFWKRNGRTADNGYMFHEPPGRRCGYAVDPPLNKKKSN